VPLNAAQRTYYANLGIFDHLATLALGTINLIASILFFAFAHLPYHYLVSRLC